MNVDRNAPQPYELPAKERRDRIARIYVRHAAINRAWDVLERSFKYGLRPGEAESTYIIGYSRCGKSETIKRFIKEKTGKRVAENVPLQVIEGNGVIFVYADLTNGATPFVLSQNILDKLFGDLLYKRIREPEAATRLIEVFGEHQVHTFIIDEAQQLFNGHGPGAADKLAKWLLPLENARAFRTVLVGAPELETLLTNFDATNQRKGGLTYLEPFAFKTATDKARFERFVTMFAADLPFVSTCLVDDSGKCSEWMLRSLFYATRGRPGALAKLCEHATIEAFEDKKTGGNPRVLDLEHLALAFDIRLLSDHRMNRINPFRVKGAEKLPTIPLNLASEMDFLADQENDGQRKVKKVGGRLHGGA